MAAFLAFDFILEDKTPIFSSAGAVDYIPESDGNTLFNIRIYMKGREI